MKEQKLISMVAFTEKCKKEREEHWTFKAGNYSQCNAEFLSRLFNYANFLSQPLTLGMFVPCGENGEVLEEPDYWNKWIDKTIPRTGNEPNDWFVLCNQYQQAKEGILFEGLNKDHIAVIKALINNNNILTIESLINLKQLWDVSPTLTKNAIKTIYG